MSAFSIPPCLIGSFCEGQADTRRCHTQAYTISLEAYNISILYGRTKETFTTCFELQGLSALLDIHMKIITSFERDFLARGSIPVTREYQPLQRKKQHQTPVRGKVITEPQLEKEAACRRPPRRSVHNTHHSLTTHPTRISYVRKKELHTICNAHTSMIEPQSVWEDKANDPPHSFCIFTSNPFFSHVHAGRTLQSSDCLIYSCMMLCCLLSLAG